MLVCIDAPNGLSRSRAVAVQLSCFSLHTWSPVIRLICRAMACGPPLGGCSLVFHFLYTVERCWRIFAAVTVMLCTAVVLYFCRCFLLLPSKKEANTKRELLL
ncbi:hypothetical protein TcCL_ESM07540 [Trypanosoma cruzi]|nr:hypothetical protein TcCL_ESM07540 [Trypanosoma cruzi]